jgi:hypothetical protein
MKASNPLMGITPIMAWIRLNYGKDHAPNTRETIRRQTIHQFVAAGLVLYNPDNPTRPVNSPNAVYQIEPKTLDLLRRFGTDIDEFAPRFAPGAVLIYAGDTGEKWGYFDEPS